MCSRLAAVPALNVRLCWRKWSGGSAGAATTCRFVLRASWLSESQESSGKFYENSYGSMESSTGNSNRSQSCNFVVICLDSPFLFQDDIVLGSPKKHFLFRTCQISNSGKNTKFQTKDVSFQRLQSPIQRSKALDPTSKLLFSLKLNYFS